MFYGHIHLSIWSKLSEIMFPSQKNQQQNKLNLWNKICNNIFWNLVVLMPIYMYKHGSQSPKRSRFISLAWWKILTWSPLVGFPFSMSTLCSNAFVWRAPTVLNTRGSGTRDSGENGLNNRIPIHTVSIWTPFVGGCSLQRGRFSDWFTITTGCQCLAGGL